MFMISSKDASMGSSSKGPYQPLQMFKRSFRMFIKKLKGNGGGGGAINECRGNEGQLRF